MNFGAYHGSEVMLVGEGGSFWTVRKGLKINKSICQTTIDIQNLFSHPKKKHSYPCLYFNNLPSFKPPRKNLTASLFSQYLLCKDILRRRGCCYYCKRELLVNKCTLLEAEKTQESVDQNNAGSKPVSLSCLSHTKR